ncbi:MAG: hypothetical protein E7Z88_00330 [Cyanobacteria bacterium SIG27]|nr:hypothetical protein [Cyanobacteria bacterium SIG27]
MPNNTFPAKVVAYQDSQLEMGDYNQVIINKGKDDGIKRGQRFIVYSIGDELFDPDTNESLGCLEIVKGTGIASHVQDRMTTITTDNYKKVPKRVPKNSLYNLLTGIPSTNQEYIEEFVETKIPFKDVKKGDYVRPI